MWSDHILEAVPHLDWFRLSILHILLFLLEVLKDVPVLEAYLFLRVSLLAKVGVDADHVVDHGLETLELELPVLFPLFLVEYGLLLLLFLLPPPVLLDLLLPFLDNF